MTIPIRVNVNYTKSFEDIAFDFFESHRYLTTIEQSYDESVVMGGVTRHDVAEGGTS